MKTARSFTIGFVFLAASATPVCAQFDSGSDGSYGPLEALSGTVTLQVPPDGIFHCTTVTVAFGVRLRFARNSLNTPVYVLAQGLVDIQGTIDVAGTRGSPLLAGKGGPGGYDGGAPGMAGKPASAGFGPGAGRGGHSPSDPALQPGSAAYGSLPSPAVPRDGATYGGRLLVPLAGGSGGGGWGAESGQTPWGGAGGGGAILLASTTEVRVSGNIVASGEQPGNGSNSGGGSGGAIRIVAPRVTTRGGLHVPGGGSGGHGWIRIDALDRSGVENSFNPAGAFTLGSFMAVFPGPCRAST
jgi:hypothetical protein